MLCRKIGLAVFIVFCLIGLSAVAFANQLNGRECVPGELVIKLKQDTVLPLPNNRSAQSFSGKVAMGIASLDALATKFKAVRSESVFKSKIELKKSTLSTIPSRVAQDFNSAQYQKIVFAADVDLDAVIAAYQNDPNIEFAEPNYIRRPIGSSDAQPTDTDSGAEQDENTSGAILALPGNNTDENYSKQWHLDAINAPQAWQFLEDKGINPGGSRDVIVAIIDTGVDYTHPDLAGNMWINTGEIPDNGMDDDGNGFVDDIHGANLVAGTGDPTDDHGHGTHVAGIVAAQANNGIGGVGVAYNSQIMAVKAAQYSGVLTTADIAEGILYAVDKGADVINMSFGGYFQSQVEEDALAVAFGQAVLVAAAGNDAKNNEVICRIPAKAMYPASYPWVLGVMASAQSPNAYGDWLASFSNRDVKAENSIEYNLMAPGSGIYSTLPGNRYASWSGTSMSTPVVSGIAALVRSYYSDKDKYSSRFVMGQIAPTGPLLRGYSPPCLAPISYHMADAQTALASTPQPSLTYLEHWLFDDKNLSAFNDDDGRVDAGETVDLAITIRNHWGKADNVAIKLEPVAGVVGPDPYVTMIIDTVNYGAVGSFSPDDNGLVYDTAGAIIGVNNPFRFSVRTDTPNEHIIPFKVTITSINGFDTGDSTLYAFESNFFITVTNGRELPRIISQDMVLTKDTKWIVPDATLIEAGVTVTIKKATKVQFYSSDPLMPYATDPLASITVKGNLNITGAEDEPAEFSLTNKYKGRVITIQQTDQGIVNISYAKMENPSVIANEIDHTEFLGTGIFSWSESINGTTVAFWSKHFVAAKRIMASRFQSLGNDRLQDSASNSMSPFNFTLGVAPYGVSSTFANFPVEESLFENNFMRARWDGGVVNVFENNVLLNNSRVSSNGWRNSYLYFSNGSINQSTKVNNNAFLERYINPHPNLWTGVRYDGVSSTPFYLDNNYWGTTSATIIDALIYDYNDDYNLGEIIYQPILATAPETAYPFVVDVALSNSNGQRTGTVGAEAVTFTVAFNRDMDTTVQPQVSFGPAEPYTDFIIYGTWQDDRNWVGILKINTVTGDGYQTLRVAGARAASDHWLVTGDDSERFRFEIITSGTESMNLQASGGEGSVDLMWTQNDFDLLAGFHLYRSDSQDGIYARINTAILTPDQRDFRDTNVNPGQPYYYKFTVVKSDMTESDASNIATATPTDTIAPVISHTPITQAVPGLSVTLYADVTDNVGVQAVTFYYRSIGGTDYSSRTMVSTSGDRYSASLEGSMMASPGAEYYIEAFDGVSTTRFGRAELPYQIIVVDRPVVTAVSPNHGPLSGGTLVSVTGSNFKAGAGVSFGGAACDDIVIISATQLTCTSPPHFPETVDVSVVNPDDQTGTLLRGFTFESDTASISLPNTGGGQNEIVQVPVNIANVKGLAAASLTIAFDGNVLKALGAVTGTITPGWSIVSNLDTPGEIRISMASSGGTTSGSGTLVMIEFEVIALPGKTCALQLKTVVMNDAAIPVETADGSFAVDQTYSVSGAINLWKNGGDVAGTRLTLAGDRLYSGTSNDTGVYSMTGIPTGNYTLTPSKSDDVEGISAYDAALVLQHDAGVALLSGNAAVAADVNKSGAVTSMDAFYILQKAVDLIDVPFTGAGVVWDFSPSNISITSLNADLSEQDFTAILIGDVSGNWNQKTTPAGAVRSTTATTVPLIGEANLVFPDVFALPNGEISVSIAVGINGESFTSADITFTFDPTILEVKSVGKGDLVSNWMVATNLGKEGQVQVGMAGKARVNKSGELLKIRFKVTGSNTSITALTFTQGQLDEGRIATALFNGSLSVNGIMGDVNGDQIVDLSDLVLVFKVMSGKDLTGTLINTAADVDGDKKIGIEEVLYILKEISRE